MWEEQKCDNLALVTFKQFWTKSVTNNGKIQLFFYQTDIQKHSLHQTNSIDGLYMS